MVVLSYFLSTRQMRNCHIYMAPLGPYGPGPYGPPWALMGRALMGRALMGWALVGRALMDRALMGALGPMGRALMGTLVDQRLGSMPNPLNLLATLKLHKAIHDTYIYI